MSDDHCFGGSKVYSGTEICFLNLVNNNKDVLLDSHNSL